MATPTTSSKTQGNAPYALSNTIDWAEVRAALATTSSPPISSPPSPSPSPSTTASTSTSSSKPAFVNSWVSTSALAMYLSAKEAGRISSAPWRGWVPTAALFDRVSADPKQTFNELVQKGLVTSHKFSEYHCNATCRWIVTLEVEDKRLEERKFEGEHRSKGGAKGEAIRRLIVAIVKQHIGFEEEQE